MGGYEINRNNLWRSYCFVISIGAFDINGSVREVIECLDGDFHIRMGVDKTETRELLQQPLEIHVQTNKRT